MEVSMQKYDSVSSTDGDFTTVTGSEKTSGKSGKSGKSAKVGRDIWWADVNFTAGKAQILTNCWGHVSVSSFASI